MKNMTLKQITECCGGTYFGDRSFLETEVTGISIDSREVKPGGLFVPIRGERVDGHSFISGVLKAGALACLSEEPIDDPKRPYILVESTRASLGRMAAYYRRSLGIQVVGVTGSVGKTSTKEMIASVLKEQYNVHKTAGNFNNEIGLPLTVFGLTDEHEIAVLEMGISDFGEMHRLAEIAAPDICVMTNIGLCHLENLGSREGILKAKTEVFSHMNEGGTVILNGDDDMLATVQTVNGKKPIFYTYHEAVTRYAPEEKAVYADGVRQSGMEGIRMTLHLCGLSREVTIPIPGEHNIYNALAAACVGAACGMDLDTICKGIASVKTINGRSNLIEKDGITVIDDCYNANPVSMCASIDVLSGASGRKIAILGDMGELGEKECELHARIGRYAAEKGIDYLYCTGELSREMVWAAGAVKGSRTKAVHFADRETLLQTVCADIQKGDTLLVKASHFMKFNEIVSRLT